jgi:hypothetical protein
MRHLIEKWDITISLLQAILSGIDEMNKNIYTPLDQPVVIDLVQVPFKGSEIYLLHKAFVDSGGTLNENYKTLLEKTAASIANKNQKGFSAQSLIKYSDKVDLVAKENVKRFLQKMIRNIDSYD